ncbi:MULTISPECIES: DUF4231 domain-containing protein [unclassified Isoptericola]|uniref:DUF4231 domain-containing protein n=1 Tax=unclassified Isoptericola TaxID=2623355 RepID=UPI0027139880|nr:MULTISPECIES: DUF4231 domain-containing protein [unclassified Isoptericola]MDO8145642.1 DUF4231 domain-containing protein [Isoptericola sp. 178]MDO8152115.1 DUF4231 domain-containing protein [Isoptericola sp. b408]
MNQTPSVVDGDLPQLFQAADVASQAGQRAYVGMTRWRLVMLSAAATVSVASWRVGSGDIDVLAGVAALLFVAALMLEVVLWRSRPDKAWYDGRAVAESAKSVAWKFAVGGNPFPVDADSEAMRAKLIRRLKFIREQYPELELEPISAPAISNWMIEQREQDLDSRKSVYLNERVRGQRSWYEKKARYNRRRRSQWRVASLALEFAGFLASALGVVMDMQVVVAPAIAAIAGGVVAWLETKQHDNLYRAYSAAVSDLTNIEASLQIVRDEDRWVLEVDDAEEAISREHVGWRASRSR